MTASTTSPVKTWRWLMRNEEPEWLVWALVAIMLAIGGLVGLIVERRTAVWPAGNLTLRAPAGWVSMAAEDAFDVLHVAEPFETALYPASVRVRRMPVTEISTTGQNLGDLALKWSDQQTANLVGYKVLSVGPMTVRGQDAVKIEYVYVAEPPMSGPNGIPVIAHANDVLIQQGDTVTIVSLSAEAAAFDGQATIWGRILASLKLN